MGEWTVLWGDPQRVSVLKKDFFGNPRALGGRLEQRPWCISYVGI